MPIFACLFMALYETLLFHILATFISLVFIFLVQCNLVMLSIPWGLESPYKSSSRDYESLSWFWFLVTTLSSDQWLLMNYIKGY